LGATATFTSIASSVLHCSVPFCSVQNDSADDISLCCSVLLGCLKFDMAIKNITSICGLRCDRIVSDRPCIWHTTFRSRDSDSDSVRLWSLDFRFFLFFAVRFQSLSFWVRCQSLSFWVRVSCLEIGYRLMCLLIHVDVPIYLGSTISVLGSDMQSPGEKGFGSLVWQLVDQCSCTRSSSSAFDCLAIGCLFICRLVRCRDVEPATNRRADDAPEVLIQLQQQCQTKS